MARVAVLFGGPAPEHDISVLTGLQSVLALQRSSHDVTALHWTVSGELYAVRVDAEAADFVSGPPAGSRRVRLAIGGHAPLQVEARLGRSQALDVDVVVNCCHGGPGEDGSVQGVLDLAGLRYTGPTARGAALGMDKLATRALAQQAEIPTIAAMAFHGDEPPFAGPWIVKPRYGGSSIGIETVDDLATARKLAENSPHLRGGAVIEPFLTEVQDLNIAVLTANGLELSDIERPLRLESEDVYGYDQKYLGGTEGLASAPRELPAEIPDAIASAIRDAAKRLTIVLDIRGIARLDFLWNPAADAVYFNEVNTIPGALAWYLWITPRRRLLDILELLIDEALRDGPRMFTSEGADGRALRAAGSIASKLA